MYIVIKILYGKRLEKLGSHASNRLVFPQRL